MVVDQWHDDEEHLTVHMGQRVNESHDYVHPTVQKPRMIDEWQDVHVPFLKLDVTTGNRKVKQCEKKEREKERKKERGKGKESVFFCAGVISTLHVTESRSSPVGAKVCLQKMKSETYLPTYLPTHPLTHQVPSSDLGATFLFVCSVQYFIFIFFLAKFRYFQTK